ncbi:MAG: citrate synthase, partial [Phycisphaerales bacterium]|nr:citrate synthase [Phycisphaerales bacterium]
MSESGSSTVVPPAAAKKPGAGLEGVVAVQSEICFIDGNAGRLVYRGYDIADLVEHATFEETAFLLWDGKLPNRSELKTLRDQLGASAALSPHVTGVLKA